MINVIEYVKGQENIATDATDLRTQLHRRGRNSPLLTSLRTISVEDEEWFEKIKEAIPRKPRHATCSLGRIDYSHVKASANRIGD